MKKGWKNLYTVALKFWDEFNANFVLSCFSRYSTMEIWQLYLKHLGKNNKAVHLKLVISNLFWNLCHTKPWQLVHLRFCVFQTKLNKAFNIFCRLPKWIRNAQMIPGFRTRLEWERGWKSCIVSSKDWRSKNC